MIWSCGDEYEFDYDGNHVKVTFDVDLYVDYDDTLTFELDGNSITSVYSDHSNIVGISKVALVDYFDERNNIMIKPKDDREVTDSLYGEIVDYLNEHIKGIEAGLKERYSSKDEMPAIGISYSAKGTIEELD